MPKTRDKTKPRATITCVIHKENQEFVIKSAEKAGCKNESEYVNALIRRLRAGIGDRN